MHAGTPGPGCPGPARGTGQRPSHLGQVWSSLSGSCVPSPAPPLSRREFKVALTPHPVPVFPTLPQGKSWTKPWGPPATYWGSWERPEDKAGVLREEAQQCTGARCCSASKLQHPGPLHGAGSAWAPSPAPSTGAVVGGRYQYWVIQQGKDWLSSHRAMVSPPCNTDSQAPRADHARPC